MASKKGQAFERHICRLLSLWWSRGKRDDIFWRTAGSGGMATRRRKKKDKKTFGQYSDVQATDPIGQPLLDCCVIELKRGYKDHTFSNILEKSYNVMVKQSKFEEFIWQAFKDSRSKEAGKEWILIVKRDGRDAILLTNIIFYNYLTSKHSTMPRPIVGLHCIIYGLEIRHRPMDILVMPLSSFLEQVKPRDFKRYARNRIRK